jgi:uncharacterized protein
MTWASSAYLPCGALARRGLLVLLLALPVLPARAADLPVGPLSIETKNGPVEFTVELANTPDTRAHGLMFRKELASDRGMLFDFEASRQVAFWMRNTLIPLDMIFIDAGGVIVHIHERAQPHDETGIPSLFPVRAVLEIAGGEARKQGIAIGDRVRHSIFGNSGGSG